MENIVRASDLTDAMTTIRAQKDKLNEALVDLAKWKIAVVIDIVPSTFELKVTATKPDGSGFIKTFSAEDVRYYANDPNTLTQIIIDLIVERLVTPVLVNEITYSVNRAVQVLSKISR